MQKAFGTLFLQKKEPVWFGGLRLCIPVWQKQDRWEALSQHFQLQISLCDLYVDFNFILTVSISVILPSHPILTGILLSAVLYVGLCTRAIHTDTCKVLLSQ